MRDDDILLDVMIATHGVDGLRMVHDMHLPRVDGVRYLVSWQVRGVADRTIPEALMRDDIKIIVSETSGLSVNRNILFRAATAPYCLIADNDLVYKPDQLRAIIATFESDPTLDVAQFMYDNALKQYPTTEVDLTHHYPKNHHVTSFEMAFRRESVVGKVWVNERLGVGAPLGSGEDPVFMFDCRRLGLNCRFYPIVITYHAGLTTGDRPMLTPEEPRAEGAIVRYFYGLKGFPRIPLIVWREWRKGRVAFWAGLKHYTTGFFTKIK